MVNKWKNFKPLTFRNLEIDVSLILNLKCPLEHYCIRAMKAAKEKEDLERVN